jgi:Ataxin-3
MLSIGVIDKNEDLTKKTGFICNNAAHWFTIRKIDGIWYNLNSTNRRLP